MRARNQDDGLESLLLLWGAWSHDMHRFQTSAARIMAAEIAADPDRKPKDPDEPSLENYQNPTQANVRALSGKKWAEVYTLHNAIIRLNRLWLNLLRLRYQKRKTWEEIDQLLKLDERARKVCMTLIRRELRIDLACAGHDA